VPEQLSGQDKAKAKVKLPSPGMVLTLVCPSSRWLLKINHYCFPIPQVDQHPDSDGTTEVWPESGLIKGGVLDLDQVNAINANRSGFIGYFR
jgi:hypothetical protein